MCSCGGKTAGCWNGNYNRALDCFGCEKHIVCELTSCVTKTKVVKFCRIHFNAYYFKFVAKKEDTPNYVQLVFSLSMSLACAFFLVPTFSRSCKIKAAMLQVF